MQRVDLHTHTTCSDGATPPRELIRQARAVNLDVIAVTDHDSVEAIPECLDEGKSQGIQVIPGIEMSSRLGEHDVHVLGYGIDHASPELGRRLAALQEGRRLRVTEICGRLKSLGVALEPGEVLKEAGGKSVGRRHVARAMVKKGIVRAIEEAFQKYLGTGSPANVPANELSPADAATLIRSHGGLPVLAHPGFLGTMEATERVVDSAPLAGIEVFHRYRSATRHLLFLDLARRRNLLVTGGSDFHGNDHPKNGALGSHLTPPAEWKALLKRLAGL